MMGIGIALFLSAVVYVISLKFQKPALQEIYSQRNIPPAKQPI
jgi:hypothetical protein